MILVYLLVQGTKPSVMLWFKLQLVSRTGMFYKLIPLNAFTMYGAQILTACEK